MKSELTGKATDTRNKHAISRRHSVSGITSGLIAAFLLGWAPILGKLAYRAQVDPLTLAALRTLVAAIFLWGIYATFWRKMLFIRWQHILGCVLVGVINGLGSLFYYSGLGRLDASRASLLNALYPVWVVLFLAASGQTIHRFTLFRLSLSMLGAILVTSPSQMSSMMDFLGAMLMVASAAMYGWYLVMGQWVLADVPARSGTLYIITGMAITVALARVIVGIPIVPISTGGWGAIIALGLTTALSRLAMFLSLEQLGGVQTAIIGLTELALSLGLAFIFLGDRLTLAQWFGAVLLLGGGMFARVDVEQGATPAPSFNPMDR
ncbi:MAG: DMT family transporter [Anaerolineae bacterium]|nr:DMT family transporter [Anaerolineae bacterium]